MKLNYIIVGILATQGFGFVANAQINNCQDAVNALTPIGTACLQIADFNQRKTCFDQAPGKAGVNNDLMNTCSNNGGPLMQLKSQLMAQEQASYPSQQSALNGSGNNNGNNNGGNNNGGNKKGQRGNKGQKNQNGGNNNNGQNNGGNTGNNGNNNGNNNGAPTAMVTAAQCSDVAAKLSPVGTACLNIADFNQRKSCFDQAPTTAGVDPAVMNGCGNNGSLNGLKAQLQATEKSKYPDQPSGLDGNNGGNNNNGNNNGNNGGQNNRGGKGQRNNKGQNNSGNNGGNNGQNNGGNNNGNNGNNGGNNNNNGNNNGAPTAMVTAAQCSDVAAKLSPVGTACLNIADFNQRKSCFDQAPTTAGVDQAVMNGCGNNGSLNGLKAQLQATEKSKYPDQPSGLDGNNGGNNNNGNNNGNNGGQNNRGGKGQRNNKGQNNSGNNGGNNGANNMGNPGGNNNNGNHGGNNNGNNNGAPTAMVTAAQCADVAAKLNPVGTACLGIADFNQRKSCFDQAPTTAGVDPAVMNGCGNNGSLNALKGQLQATEKSKYPDQPSGLDGNNGGNNSGGKNHNGKNNHGGKNQGQNGGSNSPNGGSANLTPDQCADVVSKLTPQGNACLAIADFNQRKNCFNQAPGKAGVDQGTMNACQNNGSLNALKSQLMSTEKSQYPDQGSAMDGGNGGNNQNGNHGGNNGSGPHNGNGNGGHKGNHGGSPNGSAPMNNMPGNGN